MKGILFFTVLAAVAAVAADEPQFSVRGSAPGNLEFSGGGQTIEWEFRNRGAFAGECVEVIRLSGFAGDGETPHRKQLSLRADTIRKHTMTIPAKLSGPFSIRYSLLRDGRVLYTREIRGGNYVPVAWRNPDRSFLGCYVWGLRYCGEKVLPVLKNMGISWIRCIVNWETFEKKKLTYDFSIHDRSMALLRKNDFRVLVNFEHPPAWAHRLFELPDGWRLFAERAAMFARRYPFVRVWEVWNEPDYKQDIFSNDTGAGVAAMLREFYPAVKRANPNALVAACGTAGDSPDRIERFLNSLFAHGGAKFFDLYTFHYSVARPVNRRMLKKYCLRVPVWNTEDGNRCAGDETFLRNTLAGLAASVEKSFYFLCYIPVKTRSQEEEFGAVRLLDNDLRPTRNFPLLYTMSCELNGFEFEKEISTVPGVRIFRFRDGETGAGRLVLYASEHGPRSVTFAADAPLTVVTADGRTIPVAPASGRISVPASSVLYVRGAPEVLPAPGMVEFVEPAKPWFFGGERWVTILCRNPGAMPFSGMVRLEAPRDWPIAAAEQKVELAPGEQCFVSLRLHCRTIPDEGRFTVTARLIDGTGECMAFDRFCGELALPVDCKLVPAFRGGEKRAVARLTNRGGTEMIGTVEFSAAGKKLTRSFRLAPAGSGSVEFCPPFLGSSGTVSVVVTAAGVSSGASRKLEWRSVSPAGRRKEFPIRLKSRDEFSSSSQILWRWKGPQDLSVLAGLEWTPEALEFVADVTDDLHVHPADRPSWQQDSLQIYLDGELYLLALTPNGAKLENECGHSVKGIRFHVERSGSSTRYRIAFPKPDGGQWRENDLVRFAFLVNDADEQGDREGWMYYPIDIGSLQNRNYVPIFVLAAEELISARSLVPAPGWKNNSSTAESRVLFDPEKNTLVFHAIFPPECGDRWFYPIYHPSAEELKKRYLTFDIRAEQSPEGIGFKNVQFWFRNGPKYFYPEPGRGEYRHVSIDLDRGGRRKPGSLLYFGLNNRTADEVVIHIRNFRFSDQP